MPLAARTAKTSPLPFKKRSQEALRGVSSLDLDPECLGIRPARRTVFVHGSSCRTFRRRSRSIHLPAPANLGQRLAPLGGFRVLNIEPPSWRLRRKVSRSALIAAFQRRAFSASAPAAT